MAEYLSEIYANIKDSPSTNVLKDGTGEYEDNILTCSGVVQNGGPQLHGFYFVASKQQRIGDMQCISAGALFSFKKV